VYRNYNIKRVKNRVHIFQNVAVNGNEIFFFKYRSRCRRSFYKLKRNKKNISISCNNDDKKDNKLENVYDGNKNTNAVNNCNIKNNNNLGENLKRDIDFIELIFVTKKK